MTFPGPTNFVKNNPSPPKNIFPKPLTVSTSYDTVDSNAATFPVSTFNTSPAANSFSITSPSTSKNKYPFPVAFFFEVQNLLLQKILHLIF